MSLAPYYACAVTSLVLSWQTLWGPWSARRDLLRDVAGLEAENAANRERADQLRRDIATATSRDPLVLEHVVREELGYVRPGDLVLVFK